ncbi:outer membrane transport energization protein TonB [Pseudoxanthomonas sp. CF385]|uniref:energy transducer TonB n=1 Tax=Pseudoxanthomonas sp. CF385 TaxID=1881042 RepID=UPI000885D36F|nr:energy transducer TonB [Pseudoxanthomonas sp. CF385]SDR12435.1 outer membrane transport energization protein TonB [Pseudoxanthomonas sp. CF385]
MSMPTNNDYRTPDTVEDTTVEPRRTTSPVLLMLLAFAVTAAALVWWSQSRQANETPVAALPAPVADDAVTTPAGERAAAAAERTRTERAAATRPAAVSRDARPLAGNAEPKYPASMLRAGVGGTVVVLAEVDAQGNPIDVRVVERSGERDLDRAAVSAVRQWRFEPAMRNGKAIATSVKVPVDFKPI